MRKLVPIVVTLAFAACSKQPDASSTSAAGATTTADTTPAATTTTNSNQTAVAPEVNPPGDIPDTQQFVKYASTAGGYELDVPEGWARKENGADVQFSSKYDGVAVNVSNTATAPTVASARNDQAKAITAQGHADAVTGVSEVSLPAGKVVVIKYESNSDPNAVTNKQIRLENQVYLYFKNGKLASLTLWAPKGADNVDQWNRMSKSFRWR